MRQPEENGCIERFFRTLKEQLLWIRHFRDLEELRAALIEFRTRYNHHWILQRLNYRTPVQARHDFTLELQPAARLWHAQTTQSRSYHSTRTQKCPCSVRNERSCPRRIPDPDVPPDVRQPDLSFGPSSVISSYSFQAARPGRQAPALTKSVQNYF
ncbi:MAG: integrase core domain-containing protein [Steroidobacteraceae bacterium]